MKAIYLFPEERDGSKQAAKGCMFQEALRINSLVAGSVVLAYWSLCLAMSYT